MGGHMRVLHFLSRTFTRNCFLRSSCIFSYTPSYLVQARMKYTQNTGVKGLRNRRFIQESKEENDEYDLNEEIDLEDSQYDLIANTAMNVMREMKIAQRIFVIQPYVKWGPKKSPINPDLQLQEAEALIKSLPEWKVELSIKVPLESLERKALFGKGKMDELKDTNRQHSLKGNNITCVFISKGTLSFAQKRFLEYELKVPVMDRYSIVIQILRLHAITAEAKIQVAMAEIPYIWSQMKDANVSTSRTQGYSLTDAQREILKSREKKLKQKLEDIRAHRKLLRNKRKQKNFPVVAVVGYTNAGKTSLIKALTDEEAIQPRDQLFATLDVTAHAGYLPCNLEVIYMDTVGFMSDIPTGLIECFIATLEDAMLADVIVHVQDLSHENYYEQKKHVEETLRSLKSTITLDKENKFPPIVNVGNKVDLLSGVSQVNEQSDMKLVSSKTLIGVNDLLLEIESKILKATNRRKITFRISSGGQEMAWLYKNSAVIDSKADPKNQQNILLDVIITNSKLEQFKHCFVK